MLLSYNSHSEETKIDEEKGLFINMKINEGLSQPIMISAEKNQNIKKSAILAQTVKTGIIKSNLIPMFAGLTLSMFKNQYSLLDKLPEMVYATGGSILVIGAAGAFNNVYDRDIDAMMERTKKRPTVTGEMPVKTTLLLAVVMTFVGLAILYLASPLASFMGFLGLFFYVMPYTMWTKRYTVWNTEVGSISGAIPPLIGWAAISNDIFHPASLGLFIVMVIWQMPHFYAIAIRKHADYKAANVPMLPVAKGMRRTYIQSNVYLVLLIASSLLFGQLSLGIMLVAALLGMIWLLLSIYGYRNMEQDKWAKIMFVYSLFHMMILFVTVIIYSLVGVLFELY